MTDLLIFARSTSHNRRGADTRSGSRATSGRRGPMKGAVPDRADERAAVTSSAAGAELVHRLLDRHGLLVGQQGEIGVGHPFDVDSGSIEETENAPALLC